MAYSIQPTGKTYFQRKNTWALPPGIAHKFYASWEDTLWDLLLVAKTPAGAKVLVPEFFCGDVVKNMRVHGLQTVWYPVDQQLQTNPLVFAEYVAQHQPAVIVIFHPVGISNTLFQHRSKWLSVIPVETILIEDCVHRVLQPQDIQLIHPRHVVMDSLRKVVPLAGSNVFGSPEFLNFSPTASWKTWWYQVLVFGWWGMFQFFLLTGQLPFGQPWNRLMNWFAEKAMLAGYEVIGDNRLAGQAWSPFLWGAKHLNIRHIRTSKKKQVALYQKELGQIWKNSKVFSIPFSSYDAEQLRGFPIGLQLATAEKILQSLRQSGLLVRFELNDSPWARKQKIIYLPLGPHLRDADVIRIAQTVTKTLDCF